MAQLVDFSQLGDLYNTYRQAARQREGEQALQQFAQNGQQFDPATRQLIAANPQLGMSLAQIALANKRDERDFGFRQQEAARAQTNADRSYGLQEKQFTAGIEGARMPPGFERDPATGGQRPIKGGVADPAYIESVTNAKDKGKQFNAGEITKLTEEGGKFSSLANFSTTFQDRFAGYKVPMAGNAAMTAGRYLPEGVVGPDVAEGSRWWQGYDRYKNVVRNELFGSALTANEQAAFERADISPGMDPKQIRENLKTQTDLLKDAMKRKAGALVAGGYQAEPIARAFGMKLEDLGVDTAKKGQPKPVDSSSWKTKETITAARANPSAALSEAQQAIQRGADPRAVAQRLQQVGIDPSPLFQNSGFAGPGQRQ